MLNLDEPTASLTSIHAELKSPFDGVVGQIVVPNDLEHISRSLTRPSSPLEVRVLSQSYEATVLIVERQHDLFGFAIIVFYNVWAFFPDAGCVTQQLLA